MGWLRSDAIVQFLANNEWLLACLNVAAVGGLLFGAFKIGKGALAFVVSWYRTSFVKSVRLFIRRYHRAILICSKDVPTLLSIYAYDISNMALSLMMGLLIQLMLALPDQQKQLLGASIELTATIFQYLILVIFFTGHARLMIISVGVRSVRRRNRKRKKILARIKARRTP